MIADAVLFQLVKESDFSCKSLRFLAREILSEVILSPLISLISDPDYINQTIIWLVGYVVEFLVIAYSRATIFCSLLSAV